jgi:short-subunit dehydrogenase
MDKRTIIIYGASLGLGRYYFNKLEINPMYKVIGISRSRPQWAESHHHWITADLSEPLKAREAVLSKLRAITIDVLIYNVGIWEDRAFEIDYSFLKDEPTHLQTMINTNITSCILQIHALLPKLLESAKPQIILTGSTSALDNTGRPEVTFNASKFALRGIAQSLRSSFKDKNLSVTLMNPGYIDTDNKHSTAETLSIHNGKQIPMEDLWLILKNILNLSPAICPLEITLPSMKDNEV